MTTLAQVQARLAAAWDAAEGHVERLTDAPVPPGWCAWRVGNSAPTVLPALRQLAPAEVHRRYLARVIANATGLCPMCSGAAGVWVDPSRTPAAWAVLPVTVRVRHATSCPALFAAEDRKWFDPRAVGTSTDQEER